MTRLSLNLLGGFEARLEPGPAALTLPHPEGAGPAGLSRPAARARRIAATSLAALLWDGMRDEQARASLRQALYDLRRKLAAPPPASCGPRAKR